MFRSAIVDDPGCGSRSEMVITLFMRMSFIPGLLRACTNSIYEGNTSTDDLVNGLQNHQCSLRLWLQTWQSALQPALASLDHNPDMPLNDLQTRNQLLSITGSYLSCLILSNRLMTALGADAYGSLETESCSLARQIFSLNSVAQRDCTQGNLYLSCSLKIAETTLLTTADWFNWACSSTSEAPKRVPKIVFLRWISLLGIDM